MVSYQEIKKEENGDISIVMIGDDGKKQIITTKKMSERDQMLEVLSEPNWNNLIEYDTK